MSDLKQGPILQQLVVEAVSKHNVLPLTGRCNLSCIFCSHHHNPPGTKAFSFGPLPEDYLVNLASYLDPEKKIIIGESATRLREGEPLTHPRFISLLQKIRELYPDTTIQVTTNGLLLNRRFLKALAALKPLELVISVNSISAAGRFLLMGDPAAVDIRTVIEMLWDLQIGFQGSVVGMPHLVGFEDLRQTLVHLDQAGVRSIRLLLPGFTRLTKPDLLPAAAVIKEIYALVDSLQVNLRAPLLVEPPQIADLKPVISGVIRNSPADEAGLRSGDQILEIDGSKPFSRVEAFKMLAEKSDPELIIRRMDESISTSLVKKSCTVSGIAVSYDLDPEEVDRVERSIDSHGKNLMLLSTPALRRWELALQARAIANINFLTVQSTWFGGTINSAGLLTVDDYRTALAGVPNLKNYSRILVPALSFDRGGFDLAGQHYLALADGGLLVKLIQ